MLDAVSPACGTPRLLSSSRLRTSLGAGFELARIDIGIKIDYPVFFFAGLQVGSEIILLSGKAINEFIASILFPHPYLTSESARE